VACIRLLPEALRAPVLALPPRDGRALLRRVGVFGAMSKSLSEYALLEFEVENAMLPKGTRVNWWSLAWLAAARSVREKSR
jgi:hypothetical protein